MTLRNPFSIWHGSSLYFSLLRSAGTFLLGILVICSNSAGLQGVQISAAAPGDLLVSNIGDPTSGGIKRYRSTDAGFVGDYLVNRNIKGMVQAGETIYAADNRNSVVVRLNIANGEASVFGSGNLDGPHAVALRSDGKLYVSDREGIKRFDPVSGEYLGVIVALSNVFGLGFGPDGLLYTSGLNGVNQYNPDTGAFLKQIFPGLYHGLTFGPNGNLYAVSTSDRTVFRFAAPSYGQMDVFTSGGNLSGPAGLAFGPNGDLFVVSNLNNSVKRFNGQTGAYINDFIASGANGLFGPSALLFLATPPAEEPPRLSISYDPSQKTITLSWPKTTSVFQLVTSTALPGGWSAVNETPTASATEFSLTLTTGDPQRYFQLVEIATP